MRPTTALVDHSNTMYALCIQFGRCRCLKHVLNELSSRSRKLSRKNIGKFLIVFYFNMTFCKVLACNKYGAIVLTMILLVITIYYRTICTLSEFRFGIYFLQMADLVSLIIVPKPHPTIFPKRTPVLMLKTGGAFWGKCTQINITMSCTIYINLKG